MASSSEQARFAPGFYRWSASVLMIAFGSLAMGAIIGSGASGVLPATGAVAGALLYLVGVLINSDFWKRNSHD